MTIKLFDLDMNNEKSYNQDSSSDEKEVVKKHTNKKPYEPISF